MASSRMLRTSVVGLASLAAALAAALSGTAQAAPTAPQAAPQAAPAAVGARASGAMQEPGVTVSLWEWSWRSIASECPRLAAIGYDGVQVAPPQDSVKRTSTATAPSLPAPVVGGLPGRRLRPDQPDGRRAAVPRHGRRLPQGRGQGLRRRGHQPHDRPGETSYGGRPSPRTPTPTPVTSPTTSTSPRGLSLQRRRDRRLQQQDRRSGTATWSGSRTSVRRPRRSRRGWPRTSTSSSATASRASGSTRASTWRRPTWTRSTTG